MVDPYTEAIQIQGRFRTKFEDGQTYNSLTHITNTRDLEVLSDEEVTQMIDEYTITYRELLQRYHSATDDARKKGLKQQLKNICEDYLLDEQMNIDHFAIDNKYNEERVKRYYLTRESLREAYEATQFFNVEYEERQDIIGTDDIFRIKNAPSEKERNRRLILKLWNLDNECKNTKKINKEPFIQILRESDYEHTDLVIEAYETNPFGIHIQATLDACSTKSLQEFVENNRNEKKRKSKEVIKAITKAFGQYIGRKIAKKDSENIFKEIYEEFGITHNRKGITAKVNQQTVKEYFDVSEHNAEKPNKWLIKRLLPEFEELLQE